jgi:hypothetical protein
VLVALQALDRGGERGVQALEQRIERRRLRAGRRAEVQRLVARER